MLRFGKISVAPHFWIMPIAMLLLGSADVLPAIIATAILHEAGHLAALNLFGVDVEGITFTAFGVEIRADLTYLPYWKDMICTAAGPLINILAAIFLARVAGAYLYAGSSLVQGVFNLLPLSGLDGARLLRSGVSWLFGPVVAQYVVRAVEIVFMLVFAVSILYAVIIHRAGGFLFLALLGVFVSIWREMCGK